MYFPLAIFHLPEKNADYFKGILYIVEEYTNHKQIFVSACEAEIQGRHWGEFVYIAGQVTCLQNYNSLYC